jgi:hypothetical protein
MHSSLIPLQGGENEEVASAARSYREPDVARVKKIGWFLLAVPAIVFFNGPLEAQQVAGSMQGKILTAAGQPEAEVRVAVSGRHLLGVRTDLTDSDGFFRIVALPPGEYTVQITKIGFRAVALERVRVGIGRATQIGPVLLEVQPIPLEALVIVAPEMTIDPVHTTVGATLDATDYDALPVERDYKSIINILPFVNTSYHGDPVNSGGSTGLENMYFIDGVNVTSVLNASTGTSLPYNFVRSIDVKVGGYQAEFGRGLGAVVNAVTYSGTNDHEANVFAFLSHSALAGSPMAEPDLRVDGFVSYDVGLRLSGPVLRDRLWYSAAYNPRIDRADKEIPGHGLYPDQRTAHVFAGKLTWQAAPWANVELSTFGDPTVHHSVEVPASIPTGATVLNPDPYLRRPETGGLTVSLRTTVDVGAGVQLVGSLAHSSGRQSSLAETTIGATESMFIDYVSNAFGGGLGFPMPGTVEEGRTAAALRGTASLGRHAVTVGIEYEDTRVSRDERTPGQGVISQLDPSVFVVDSQTIAGTNHNRVPTAYLQDSWRVADRFTVNAGVRWSAQSMTGASGGTAHRFPDEWQPRVGFVWQLGRAGAQRVYGSYGRFYQQEPLNFASTWYVCSGFASTTYSADPREPDAPVVDRFADSGCEEGAPPMAHGSSAEHFDEFTLGYELMLGRVARLSVRGIRRDLRSSLQFGFDWSRDPLLIVLGTPGKGEFDFLPSPKRDYTALELGVDGTSSRFGYRASYVLSRTWGNYTGLFGSDIGIAVPSLSNTFFQSHQATNSTGLLPNDRPHVLKLVGSYQTTFGLMAGAFFTWQSGTPLNEFGAAGLFGVNSPAFLVPRGSVGRTPSIWDLNLRFAYEMPWLAPRSRLVLDLLHVGNPQTPVRLDEMRFHIFDPDTGMPTDEENAQYLQPVAFQPPMTARLGIEVSF